MIVDDPWTCVWTVLFQQQMTHLPQWDSWHAQNSILEGKILAQQFPWHISFLRRNFWLCFPHLQSEVVHSRRRAWVNRWQRDNFPVSQQTFDSLSPQAFLGVTFPSKQYKVVWGYTRMKVGGESCSVGRNVFYPWKSSAASNYR